MKTTLSAILLTAALAQPAAAITFPSLTTIYVGTGVRDDGGGSNVGIATTFICSNVSGASAQVRFLVLSVNGTVVTNHTATVLHGGTYTASTHSTFAYDEIPLNTGPVGQGVVNIESTQSGVFCSCKTVSAGAAFPDGVSNELVRVNAHPGTVE